MKDKYMIIYQIQSCLFRKEIVVNESDLNYWVDKIINDYKGEIFTISKCLFTK